MWSYVAPGAAVSVNVGRTIVVPTFAAAMKLLKRIFSSPPSGEELARCDGSRPSDERRAALAELDSIQVDHVEGWARGTRRELIMLRWSECTELTPSSPGVMCGRHPHLTRCAAASLRRMSVGQCGRMTVNSPASGFSKTVRRASGGVLNWTMSRNVLSSPCALSRCFQDHDGVVKCAAR